MSDLPLILGDAPLGVTGVVAVDVPDEDLSPLPARRCTHSIPFTGSSLTELKPPLPATKLDKPVIDVPPLIPGLSILYLRNSAGLISSCLCPRGKVPLGVGTGLGAPPRTESKSNNCLILRIEGDRVLLSPDVVDDVICCVDNDLAGMLGCCCLVKCRSNVDVAPGRR